MKRYASVGIIGAGPLGIELAIELKKNRINSICFDKGQVCQAVFDYPAQTHFFSSSERISISNIPIQTIDQQKCTREHYLAYIRSAVLQFDLDIKTYEEVTSIDTSKRPFVLKTVSNHGEYSYTFDYMVLATGGTSYPRTLNVAGEDMEHVSNKLEDVHKYFNKKVSIVGGKNSAVEAALKCFHASAKEIRIFLRGDEFDSNEIKYWLLPELLGCIRHKQIYAHYQTKIIGIEANQIFVENIRTGLKSGFETDFVIKAIGFEADMSLFHKLGIPLDSAQHSPVYNHATMETSIPDLYVLGTVVGGTQKKFHVFIENCHEHVCRILKNISKKLGINVQSAIKPIKKNTQELEE